MDMGRKQSFVFRNNSSCGRTRHGFGENSEQFSSDGHGDKYYPTYFEFLGTKPTSWNYKHRRSVIYDYERNSKLL
jgi:hypothetical protein